MLLSTMSYEEMYCEILKDFRDVKEYYDVAIKAKKLQWLFYQDFNEQFEGYTQ